MYTKHKYPGKFEGCASRLMAEVVYNASLDGGEELGDVENFGWYGIVKGKRYSFLVIENGEGFVYVEPFSHEEAQKQWKRIEKEYEKFCEEQEATEGVEDE